MRYSRFTEVRVSDHKWKETGFTVFVGGVAISEAKCEQCGLNNWYPNEKDGGLPRECEG